jgi:F-type H+-transporting ATPase subunit b
MDEILQQLVPLLIGSVPTIVLFISLIVAYKVILHGPLMKVLAERKARTQGAIEKAHAAIAAADAKAQEYEAKLRAARAEIFKAREERVKSWNAERDNALAAARQVARERVHAAKASLDAQTEASRQDLERSSDALAADIVRAVLGSGFSSGATLLVEGPR